MDYNSTLTLNFSNTIAIDAFGKENIITLSKFDIELITKEFLSYKEYLDSFINFACNIENSNIEMIVHSKSIILQSDRPSRTFNIIWTNANIYSSIDFISDYFPTLERILYNRLIKHYARIVSDRIMCI